jgi:hypothetical protein
MCEKSGIDTSTGKNHHRLNHTLYRWRTLAETGSRIHPPPVFVLPASQFPEDIALIDCSRSFR